MRRVFCSLLSVLVLLRIGPLAVADLDEYVHLPDASYGYELTDSVKVGTGTGHIVRMTSQTWRGEKWEHWLSIIVPANLRHSGKAILLIGGGSSRSDQPDPDSPVAFMLSGVAARCGAILAVLEQVPNQPLFGGKYEDAIIAYTFDKFLESGEADWPLLLPMVKSAVRAMDTVQAVIRDKFKIEMEKFIVTGASKRGWTTYLAAVTDERVIAIAPMVFDVLNIEKQMDHQFKTYGRFSEKVRDYTNRRIQERIQTDRGRSLTRIIDPFVHRQRLNMPKLIVLGTNDPYWTADSANLYFDDLPGPRLLHYVANRGHGLGMEMIPTVLVFLQAALDDRTLPEVHWNRQDDGVLKISWEGTARPMLWQARSDNRDFRGATWQRSPLHGSGRCEILIEKPERGWVGFYAELVRDSDLGLPYSSATPIFVLPDTYPDHPRPRGQQEIEEK